MLGSILRQHLCAQRCWECGVPSTLSKIATGIFDYSLAQQFFDNMRTKNTKTKEYHILSSISSNSQFHWDIRIPCTLGVVQPAGSGVAGIRDLPQRCGSDGGVSEGTPKEHSQRRPHGTDSVAASTPMRQPGASHPITHM
jgi:hypothetical protein